MTIAREARAAQRPAIVAWLVAYADALAANKDYLTQLDSAIGDADHGINMDRGFQAVAAQLTALLTAPAEGDIGATLKGAGMTLISTVGGASGPLYGTFFLGMAAAAAGKSELTLADWIAAFEAGVAGVIRRGKAAPGDKTMIDCLAPAVDALKAAAAEGAGWGSALRGAEEAGRRGMEATIPLVARKGRASYLGERSAGHQDPGATSAHLLLAAAVEALASED
jgi:phosphoenolpyruvate---glycerone phosphotransferase subunit DhaL